MICSFKDFKEAQISNFKDYNDIKNYFIKKKYWGITSSIDLINCDKETITSSEKIKHYVKELCGLIKMRPFGACQITYFGEDVKVAGYSMVQLIETSSITGHFVDLTNNSYIDIFSCKIYDPFLASEYTKNFFNAEEMNVHVYLRK